MACLREVACSWSCSNELCVILQLCSEPSMRIGEEYQAAIPELEEGTK